MLQALSIAHARGWNLAITLMVCTGIGILPLPLVTENLARGAMRQLAVPGLLAPQSIFAAYNKGVLDAAVPDMLKLVRRVVLEHSF